MKALVSLSGGMDSTTLLAQVVRLHGKENVIGVGFRYGSKHNRYELAAAAKVASHYGISTYWNLDLTTAMSGISCALMLNNSAEIPLGHYQSETMKQTVVPGRNLIFASLLAGVAWSNEADSVYLGIHAGDHAIYPDCRVDFFKSLQTTVFLATDEHVRIHAPFLEMWKRDILKLGLAHNVPYHLTRTCYQNQQIACGKCGACQERLEAFALCKTKDPIEYEGE